MSSFDAAILEDADWLQDWLVSQGRTPYIDFEILTVTFSDGALEVDPKGDLETLLPLLRTFAAAYGYEVAPFDVETGSVSLFRSDPGRLRGRPSPEQMR